MIELEGVGVTYPDADRPVLSGVDLLVDEGELCLVVGATGSGKSTLLGTVTGLVPHFTGGLLEGRVRVAGRDTADHPPRELADVVGVVGQDPLAGFVTDTVEEELAYTMEQLAVPTDAMRARVEEVLDVLGLVDLRRRPLADLSGGQQQRVAIGAALTAHPRVLVLDEPTSSLDPVGAEDVLAALTGSSTTSASPSSSSSTGSSGCCPTPTRSSTSPAPAGCGTGPPRRSSPTSTSSRPSWSSAGWPAGRPCRSRCATRAAARPPCGRSCPRSRAPRPSRDAPACPARTAASPAAPSPSGTATRGRPRRRRRGARRRRHRTHGPQRVRQVLAAVGARGARKRAAGTVTAGPQGTDPAKTGPADARRLVALVPQTPTDLLYLDSVGAELARADRDAGPQGRPAREVLDAILPGLSDDAHPRDLSAGQQLALVLAVQLSAGPAVLLLDEPTRGLDYRAKAALSRVLRDLAAEGRAVVLATHDVEFAATTCDRVVVLAEGEVVAQGPAQEVLTASPSFAPQVAKVLAPARYLTVAQVRAELDGASGPSGSATGEPQGAAWR